MNTRFPPEPNGRLHIGHLKAILANFHGLDGSTLLTSDKLKPTCILRYDDTNPETETDEFRKGIMEDLNWLGYHPAKVTSTSNYFPILRNFMDILLASGDAYIDASTKEEMAYQRNHGIESPWRTHNHELDSMSCIRIKIDSAHKMTCMRDPTIYRFKNNDWYPTYDFSHPIVDYLEGITHSYCTREFFIRRELYYWFIDKYIATFEPESGAKTKPVVYEFNRLDIEDVKLSKRYFLKEIAEGRASGFDDPNLFTIAGLRAHGHSAEALIHFCKNYVSYVAGDGGTIPMHTFDYAVREYYNDHVPRAFGIPKDKCLNVYIIERDQYVWINADDFRINANRKYKRLKPGNKIWLKGHVLVSYHSHEGPDDAPLLVKVNIAEQTGAHAAIQWIAHDDHSTTIDGSGNQWVCTKNVLEYHDVFQFERCGYFRIRDSILILVSMLKSSYHD
jgi:glutaminyl-tRNA synthetase